MTEINAVAFDHKLPHTLIIGEPGVAYKQAGRYFNQAFKPAKLQVVKELTPKEKEIEELRTNYAEALTEIVALRAQIAQYQLQMTSTADTSADVVAPSETVIVDFKDGIVTVNPVPDAAQSPFSCTLATMPLAAQAPSSRTLTLAGISKAG